jgi:hypothetical protein
MSDKLVEAGFQNSTNFHSRLPEWLMRCEFDRKSGPFEEISLDHAKLLSPRFSDHLFQNERGCLLVSGKAFGKYQATVMQIANVQNCDISDKMFSVSAIDEFIVSKATQPHGNKLGYFSKPTCLDAVFFRASKSSLVGDDFGRFVYPGTEVLAFYDAMKILKHIPSYTIGLNIEPCYIVADFFDALRRVNADLLKFEMFLQNKTASELSTSYAETTK